jgi:hypothetical protein
MKPAEIIVEAKKNIYSLINDEDLNNLLSDSEIIIEKDTLISDKIRLLKFEGELLIQEKSNKDEFIIRMVSSKSEGESFINSRMETYDKMWDGCGCKVEYYS